MAEEKQRISVDADDLVSLLKDSAQKGEQPSAGEKNKTPAETKERQYVDIKDVLEALGKRWKLIALVSVLTCLMAGIWLYFTYTPKYTATAKMYVNNESISIGSAKVSISAGDITAAKSLVDTYSEIIKTHRVLDAVAEQLETKYGLSASYDSLVQRIKCGSVNDTEIFYISVTDSNAETAILTANTVVDCFQSILLDIVDGSSARVVDKAEEVEAVNAGIPAKIILFFLAGFALSCLYAVAVECFFNDKVEKPEWLSQSFSSTPMLSVIPDANGSHGYRKYGYGYGYGYDNTKNNPKKKEEHSEGDGVADRMSFEVTEANNVLRTNVLLSFKKSNLGRVVGITSSAPHEGKSFTAVNLAYSLAKNGYKTLLISGDMRMPQCEAYLNQSSVPGLSNVLIGNADRDEAVRTVLLKNLSFLAAGDIPPNPSELLWSSEMKQLLDYYAHIYKYVLIDLPPVTAVIDPISVSPLLDGMIMVVRHSYSRKQFVRQTMSQLTFAGVRVLGFVYNGAGRSGKYSSKKYKNYGKSYSYGYRTPSK